MLSAENLHFYSTKDLDNTAHKNEPIKTLPCKNTHYIVITIFLRFEIVLEHNWYLNIDLDTEKNFLT